MELQKRLENKNDFIKLLNSTKRKGMDKVLEWLEKSDFYEAPASTRFHGNYEGGLLEHSLNVLTAFDWIVVGLSGITPSVPKESIIITSLLHDICKANTYKKVQRWRKDKDNKWEQYDVFEFNEDEPLGHGEKSVLLLQRIGLDLTEQELYMIRWHMGGFDESQRALHAAMTKCPAIALIHSADLIATNLMENEVNNNG